MIELTLIIIVLIIIGYKLYKIGTENNEYFANRSIRNLYPYFLIGNNLNFYLRKCGVYDYTLKLYNSFPNDRLFGIFDFTNPIYFVRDPEIIKQLAIKDFDYFEDHKLLFDADCDSFFGNTLFMLRGEKWRDMRATLSPAFTGSKMRQMFQFVSECAEQTTNFYLKKTENNSAIDINAKEFSLYTNDVIASSAFGIKVDSYENDKNEFLQNGKIAINFTSKTAILRILSIKFFPKIMKFLDIGFVDGRVQKFFTSMVLDTMKYRNEHKIFRPDMINILMDVRKGKQQEQQQQQQLNKHESSNDGFATTTESNIGKRIVKRDWSDDEIAAQCFIFFLAGYETSSTALMFTAYELALNEDVQNRLYEEVLETYRSLNGKPLQYDTVQNMKYMDMVISEVLRKYPPLPIIDRLCVKNYQYKDDTYNFNIEKGLVYWIPILGIHLDPKYYPNPNKFDPERFNEENRKLINPSTYLPFGIGPRNCIGSRFALMEIKTICYNLILNFAFEPNEKTAIPIVFENTPQLIAKNNAINLTIKRRTTINIEE